MSKNEQFEYAILEDFRSGRLTRREAALLLNTSERAVTRRAKKIREKGIVGVKHGNSGREPVNKTNAKIKDEMLRLKRETYYDFNVTHALEMMVQRDALKVSYQTFHRWCQAAHLLKHKKRIRAKARHYRERMSNEGLMLQMDGSHHDWNGTDKWCLIAMIDDATSKIPFAEFFSTEDTINCMIVVQRVIELRGIPEVIYVDRAGWFGGLKRQDFSQFKRACEELGIRVIFAKSPQAKGRIERAWRTFQDRLIPEMRLLALKSFQDANSYLQTKFLPDYWQVRNTVEPRCETNRYRPLPSGVNLDEIFCLKDYRIVRPDHTIAFDSGLYKITDRVLGSIKGLEVEIRRYRDGTVGCYLGNRQLTLRFITKPRRTLDIHQTLPLLKASGDNFSTSTGTYLNSKLRKPKG